MLADQIQTNLTHFHLWNDLSQIDVETDRGTVKIVKGTPPEKLLSEDTEAKEEYILPSATEDKWTIRQWNQVFTKLNNPKRMLMAMVTNDGTIVYYFVNNGLAKPKKN